MRDMMMRRRRPYIPHMIHPQQQNKTPRAKKSRVVVESSELSFLGGGTNNDCSSHGFPLFKGRQLDSRDCFGEGDPLSLWASALLRCQSPPPIWDPMLNRHSKGTPQCLALVCAITGFRAQHNSPRRIIQHFLFKQNPFYKGN